MGSSPANPRAAGAGPMAIRCSRRGLGLLKGPGGGGGRDHAGCCAPARGSRRVIARARHFHMPSWTSRFIGDFRQAVDSDAFSSNTSSDMTADYGKGRGWRRRCAGAQAAAGPSTPGRDDPAFDRLHQPAPPGVPKGPVSSSTATFLAPCDTFREASRRSEGPGDVFLTRARRWAFTFGLGNYAELFPRCASGAGRSADDRAGADRTSCSTRS